MYAIMLKLTFRFVQSTIHIDLVSTGSLRHKPDGTAQCVPVNQHSLTSITRGNCLPASIYLPVKAFVKAAATVAVAEWYLWWWCRSGNRTTTAAFQCGDSSNRVTEIVLVAGDAWRRGQHIMIGVRARVSVRFSIFGVLS